MIRRLLERITICRMLGHEIWPLVRGLEERAEEWLGEPECQRCGKRRGLRMDGLRAAE